MLCATSSFTVPFRLLTVLVCRASTAPALAMSKFPNGRPDNILGSPRRPLPTSHFAVAGAADVDDQAPTYSTDSASEEDHAAASRRAGARAKDPSRRPVNPKDGKVRVPWVEYDIVQGWPVVEAIFKTFSLQCDCASLISRNGKASSCCVTYRMECAYSNRLGCKWQCRIVIYFDQEAAAKQYLRKHPSKHPSGPFQADPPALDRKVYCRQSMFPVKQELRGIVHANHVCFVATGFVHSNHTAYNHSGAHPMFESFCELHAYALNFKRFEIQQWLEDRKIDVFHEGTDENGTIVRTNQMGVVVERCKRFAERFRAAAENDTGVNNGYEGKLLSLCEKYCLPETIARLTHVYFDTNTPYILPGWSANQDESLPSGGFVILLSTMNLALNFARAHNWFAGNVTMAVDHTFKVRLFHHALEPPVTLR